MSSLRGKKVSVYVPSRNRSTNYRRPGAKRQTTLRTFAFVDSLETPESANKRKKPEIVKKSSGSLRSSRSSSRRNATPQSLKKRVLNPSPRAQLLTNQQKDGLSVTEEDTGNESGTSASSSVRSGRKRILKQASQIPQKVAKQSHRADENVPPSLPRDQQGQRSSRKRAAKVNETHASKSVKQNTSQNEHSVRKKSDYTGRGIMMSEGKDDLKLIPKKDNRNENSPDVTDSDSDLQNRSDKENLPAAQQDSSSHSSGSNRVNSCSHDTELANQTKEGQLHQGRETNNMKETEKPTNKKLESLVKKLGGMTPLDRRSFVTEGLLMDLASKMSSPRGQRDGSSKSDQGAETDAAPSLSSHPDRSDTLSATKKGIPGTKTSASGRSSTPRIRSAEVSKSAPEVSSAVSDSSVTNDNHKDSSSIKTSTAKKKWSSTRTSRTLSSRKDALSVSNISAINDERLRGDESTRKDVSSIMDGLSRTDGPSRKESPSKEDGTTKDVALSKSTPLSKSMSSLRSSTKEPKISKTNKNNQPIVERVNVTPRGEGRVTRSSPSIQFNEGLGSPSQDSTSTRKLESALKRLGGMTPVEHSLSILAQSRLEEHSVSPPSAPSKSMPRTDDESKKESKSKSDNKSTSTNKSKTDTKSKVDTNSKTSQKSKLFIAKSKATKKLTPKSPEVAATPPVFMSDSFAVASTSKAKPKKKKTEEESVSVRKKGQSGKDAKSKKQRADEDVSGDHSAKEKGVKIPLWIGDAEARKVSGITDLDVALNAFLESKADAKHIFKGGRQKVFFKKALDEVESDLKEMVELSQHYQALCGSQRTAKSIIHKKRETLLNLNQQKTRLNSRIAKLKTTRKLYSEGAAKQAISTFLVSLQELNESAEQKFPKGLSPP